MTDRIDWELQRLRGECSSQIVGAERRKTAQTVLVTFLRSLVQGASLLVWRNLSFSRQTRGENWGWLHGNSLKGLEYGPTATKGVDRRSPGPSEKPYH